jgi:hypothetical protein
MTASWTFTRVAIAAPLAMLAASACSSSSGSGAGAAPEHLVTQTGRVVQYVPCDDTPQPVASVHDPVFTISIVRTPRVPS